MAIEEPRSECGKARESEGMRARARAIATAIVKAMKHELKQGLPGGPSKAPPYLTAHKTWYAVERTLGATGYENISFH